MTGDLWHTCDRLIRSFAIRVERLIKLSPHRQLHDLLLRLFYSTLQHWQVEKAGKSADKVPCFLGEKNWRRSFSFCLFRLFWAFSALAQVNCEIIDGARQSTIIAVMISHWHVMFQTIRFGNLLASTCFQIIEIHATSLRQPAITFLEL